MSVYVYIFFIYLGLIEKFISVLYIPRVLFLRVTCYCGQLKHTAEILRAVSCFHVFFLSLTYSF